MTKQGAPVFDKGAASEVHLAVLKRLDADIEEVLAFAGHVCLYHMGLDTQQWARKNVEGSLFLLKRRSNPRFQMMVLNKLATENYIENIHSGMDFEINPPYLMYTHGDHEIHGIWFYEGSDLDKVGNLLAKIKSGLPKPPVPPPNASVAEVGAAPAASGGGDDGGFWDKQVEVPANPPPKPGFPEQAPAAPTNESNNLSNLLKQAQLKNKNAQQQQAQPPAPQQQSAEAHPPPLPPSYFQQAMPHRQLEETRKAPMLSPGPSGDFARTAPADQSSNPLQKLFARASHSVPLPPGGQMPAHAAPPQQQPAPAPAPQQNKLAALFANAAQRQSMDLQPGSPRVPTPPIDPALATRQKLRTAFHRLLANDAFVDMLASEFKAAGLVE